MHNFVESKKINDLYNCKILLATLPLLIKKVKDSNFFIIPKRLYSNL